MTDTRMAGHMNTRLRSSGRRPTRARVQPRALTDLRLQIGALRRASCTEKRENMGSRQMVSVKTHVRRWRPAAHLAGS